MRSWGYGIRRVSATDILAIEPNLKQVPEHAYHVAGEGVAEPLAAARALIAAAAAQGARIIGHAHVRWLVTDGDRVTGIMTDEGPLHADETVAAAGRLVAGTDFAGADPLDRADELADELMGKVRDLVTGAEDLALDFHTTGYRPMPADGFPAIGRPGGRRGLYAVVSHSGVTLAPALGRFARDELLDGRRDRLIEPFHPDRPGLA
ncbi:MAG: FAD-binding oxidoreductase [Rhizobiales bacterium]|nr:FAD-binding oxidoreductase [Hyphomicrobiales bacterium]